MNKTEVITELKQQGFTACLENGVVMIEVKSEAERARAGKAVKELGLKGSWGTRGAINDDNFRRFEATIRQA